MNETKEALRKVCADAGWKNFNEKLNYSPSLDCILQLEWVNKSNEYHSLVQHWYPHQANIRDIPKENAFELMAALRWQARRWYKDLLCASAQKDRSPNNRYYACATYDRDYRKIGWGIQHKFACVFSNKESEK
ncbi:unnamed protein product [Cylicocyclus nassatus]|uniref:Uncharacterized protein n=1 Tax=Cylicocyclus nassatus TaxID=53992 RepID=A0AA36DRR1_CYLNA|nr:unnamed protein product [Cylicocyclus nassatus]